jgi:hypothetical protein
MNTQRAGVTPITPARSVIHQTAGKAIRSPRGNPSCIEAAGHYAAEINLAGGLATTFAPIVSRMPDWVDDGAAIRMDQRLSAEEPGGDIITSDVIQPSPPVTGTNMHLILMTHSSNPEYNGDCDYAVIELTPIVLETIRVRVALAREVKRQNPDVCDVAFYGCTPDYFDDKLAEACQDAIEAGTAGSTDAAADAAEEWLTKLEGSGFTGLPEGVDLNAFDVQRTECDQMSVSIATSDQADLTWTAYVKNTDTLITTRDLPMSKLEALIDSAAPAFIKE